MVESYQSRGEHARAAGRGSRCRPEHCRPVAIRNGRRMDHRLDDARCTKGCWWTASTRAGFKLATPRDCSQRSDRQGPRPALPDSCDCQPPDPSTTGAFTSRRGPGLFATTPIPERSRTPQRRTRRFASCSSRSSSARCPEPTEGVISSICPIHTVEGEGGDPLYGYRPAVSALINRLKTSFVAPKSRARSCTTARWARESAFHGKAGRLPVSFSLRSRP